MVKLCLVCDYFSYLVFDWKGNWVFSCCVVYLLDVFLFVVEVINICDDVVVLFYIFGLNMFLEWIVVKD